MASNQRRTAFATVAVTCGAIAFFCSPVAGFFLGCVAAVLGLLSVLRASSPRVSGARLGVLGTLLGLTAIVVKIIHGALKLLF